MLLSRRLKLDKVVPRVSDHGVVRRAAGAASHKFGPPTILRATTSTGIEVTATRLQDPLASISVHFDAGSRCENQEQLGASHFLRNLCAASGCSSTEYTKTRHLQQLGAHLCASSDRQLISYTLVCPRYSFRSAQGYLMDAVTRCQYYPWDIDDHRDQIKKDLDRITPEQRIMDKIQTAAFKGPLSNSVFCRRHVVDDMESETLRRYFKDYFHTKTCCVTSSGLSHDDTFCFAGTLMLPGKCDPPARIQSCESIYRAGYECYDLGANSETWVAIAVPGTDSATDIRAYGRCLLSFCAVAAACGTRNMADTSHRFSFIGQAPLSRLHDDVETQCRAFNISYPDAGIFGIVARSAARSACEVGQRAAEFLRSGLRYLTPDQLEIGKRRLLVDVASCEESGLCGSAIPSRADKAELIAEIGNLDPCYLQTVARYISDNCNSMAVAVVGDVSAGPTDAELRR